MAAVATRAEIGITRLGAAVADDAMTAGKSGASSRQAATAIRPPRTSAEVEHTGVLNAPWLISRLGRGVASTARSIAMIPCEKNQDQSKCVTPDVI
jgi:hypothetical protein